jgi:hypothetical protein
MNVSRAVVDREVRQRNFMGVQEPVAMSRAEGTSEIRLDVPLYGVVHTSAL